jgi:hypothetical protein
MRRIGYVTGLLATQHSQPIDQLKGEPDPYGDKGGNRDYKQEYPEVNALTGE